MDFADIARFLNVPETAARQLAENGLLPGQPCPDGWNTSFDDLEAWYVRLSGRDWADLVSTGVIDPLLAEARLSAPATSDRLRSRLQLWAKQEIIVLLSLCAMDETSLSASFRLLEPQQRANRCLALLETEQLPDADREDIELTCRCEMLLSKQEVALEFSAGHILTCETRDPLEDLPQREREIMRAYLGSYVMRLTAGLERT